MSKEMRKQINKIKNFKQFVNEQKLNENYDNNKPYINLGIDMTLDDILKFVLNTKKDNQDFDETYNDLIKTLNSYNNLSNFVTLYRLLYLNNINDINYNDIGKHFILNKNDINDELKDSIKPSASGINNWYLVTIKIPKNKINFKRTMMQNLLFPNEKEIFATQVNRDEIIDVEKIK